MATMTIDIEELDCSSTTFSSYSVNIHNNRINTIVTYIPSIVDGYISDILHANRNILNRLVIGLDVEWRPNFHRNIENPVAVLQLCVGNRCLIFQIIHASTVPQSLVDFLNNPNFKFVGVGIQEDIEKLLVDYNLGVANVVDLRPLAAQKLQMNDLRNAGLKGLAKQVLDMEVEKPKRVTMSRWDAEWLTSAQIKYACIDAFLSFKIELKTNSFHWSLFSSMVVLCDDEAAEHAMCL